MVGLETTETAYPLTNFLTICPQLLEPSKPTNQKVKT